MEPDAAPALSPALAERLDLLAERVASLDSRLTERLECALEGLEFLVDDEPRARRRLAELRASAEYEEAYGEPSPLVSVIIPTWNRTEALTTRAIPSVLSQSYENVEVVVVGDCSPPELCDAVARIEDPRIRFHNLTIQGPYDKDSYRAWLASGTPPRNAGLARARGRWIAVLDDDDEFPPTHIEVLLEFARAQRLELAYGWFRFQNPDGSMRRAGGFPPRFGGIGLQISLWHAGLRFLEFELAHPIFSTPNDWGLIRRMMRAGVTFGQTDGTTVDYVPSGRHRVGQPQRADQTPQLRQRIAELETRLSESEQARLELDAHHA